MIENVAIGEIRTNQQRRPPRRPGEVLSDASANSSLSLLCSKIVKLSDLDSHWTRCSKARCGDCNGIAKPPATLTEQLDSCPETLLECGIEGCNQFETRATVEWHRIACPHRLVSCPFPGCGAEVKCRDLEAHVELAMKDHLACTRQSFFMFRSRGADERLPRCRVEASGARQVG